MATNFDNFEDNMFMFPFERNHDARERHVWMADNIYIAYISVVLYIIVLYFGTRYMQNRARFELRLPLILWNIGLAVFSILGTVRIAPVFIEQLSNDGLHHTLCDNLSVYLKPGNYWGYLFVLSKIFELGDTVFIILRKQKLIFLHYYHHITVLLYTWWMYPQALSINSWFSFMNFAVHSFMYTYYAARAMKLRIPKPFSISITLLQISQMIAGLAINTYIAIMLKNDVPCVSTWPSILLGIAMYLSYLILFVQFFINAYVIGPTARGPSPSKKSALSNGHVEHSNGHVAHSNGHVEYTNGHVRQRNGVGKHTNGAVNGNAVDVNANGEAKLKSR